MGNFSLGRGEVQTLQMNQSHNNNIMNVNRWWTDGLNEQVTEVDITNTNG